MSAELLSPFGSNPEIPRPAASGLSAIDSTKPKETTRDRWKRRGYVMGATIATFGATEGGAHIGGTAAQLLPSEVNPLDYVHDPKWLLLPVAASYVSAVRSLGNLSKENNQRIKEGDTPLYAPSILARHRMEQRIEKGKFVTRNLTKMFGKEKLVNAAGHRSYAVPHLWMEAYYNGLAGVATYVSDLQQGATFIVGANLGAAAWANLQSDGSAYIRETGSREGIVKGVFEMKKERLQNRKESWKTKAKTIYYSKALSLASQVHI
jgi:hypothetical protein